MDMSIPPRLSETAFKPSWKNVLVWGYCREHFRKVSATENSVKARSFHLLMGMLEAIPIISQLISSIEMLVRRVFSQRRPENHSQKRTESHSQEGIEESLQPGLLEGGYFTEEYFIKKQKEPKIKEKISRAPEGSSKKTPITEFLQPTEDHAEHSFKCKKFSFFYFKCEGVDDSGWGCAWRSIQTLLSACGKEISFKELFCLFGDQKILERLNREKLKKNFKIPNAPHNRSSGWAEPFIGQLVLAFFGVDSTLLRVNDKTSICYTPDEAFSEEPIDFDDFCKRLEVHFDSSDSTPVMIDNGVEAYVLLGKGDQGFWIADPHTGSPVCWLEERILADNWMVLLPKNNQKRISKDSQEKVNEDKQKKELNL